MSKLLTSVLCAGGIALAGATAAHASPYPTQPIRMIVPYPPGGASDIFARLLGQRLSERLGQPIIIDNRPGAGGTIGADNTARAKADGYTLLLSDVAIYTIAPLLYSKLPYKADDLVPVINIASSPQLVVTASSSKLTSLRDVLAQEKRHPGSLNVASAGNGTGAHLSAVLLNRLAGSNIQHIPYKGGGAALNDVLSGQVDMMFVGTPPVMSFLANGRLRALAVTTLQRVPNMPAVPTVAESGVAGFEAVAGQGIFAPAGTPPEIIARLNQEIGRITATSEVRKRWEELGAEPVDNTPAQFQHWLNAEIAKWTQVIREADIKLD